MSQPRFVVWCLIGTACGRVGFDRLAASSAGDATRDSSGGDGAAATSCVILAATCGATGTSPCCDSSLVPGGTFYRSYDVGTDNAYVDMTNPATTSGISLDTYEVTVGRFREFAGLGPATQVSPPAPGFGARTLNLLPTQGGWDPAWNQELSPTVGTLIASLNCDSSRRTWTNTPGANESLPINCITWFEAFAFCAWDGGFLPTEAEWNHAAAGGSEQRAYPWSAPASSLAIDCATANHDPGPQPCVDPPTGAPNRVGSESPIGDGRWGHADLGGNVWEWTLDQYAVSYLNPCDDCAYLTAAPDRVVRGGSFGDVEADLRGATRNFAAPTMRYAEGGVRCARPL